MTRHAAIRYIIYRWKAKTRHGIHSPFVYAFIEQCLLPGRKINLKQKLDDYFGKERMIYVSDNCSIWQQEFQHIKKDLGHGKIVTVISPHKTHIHTSEWNKLKESDTVLLSIDLYQYGLLITQDDFKEKQHFVLKHPL